MIGAAFTAIFTENCDKLVYLMTVLSSDSGNNKKKSVPNTNVVFLNVLTAGHFKSFASMFVGPSRPNNKMQSVVTPPPPASFLKLYATLTVLYSESLYSTETSLPQGAKLCACA